MVSFFGEVVFPSSRAFWDADDEDGLTGSTISQTELSVRWLKEKPSSIKTLLIIEGKMLYDFSKECLCQDSEELCVVANDKQKKLSIIYRINEELCLWLVSPHFDVKFSGKLLEKMHDILSNAECTISITARHVSQFKSTNIPNTPSFLRMLSTKHGENICKLKVISLERPNIVVGVAAGVLTYANIIGLPSIVYILYTDGFALDHASTEPLVQLLTALNCTPQNVTYHGKNFFNKGNLYM